MFRFIIVFLFITTIAAGQTTPKDYSSNTYVKYTLDTIYGQYKISYTFKDNFDLMRTFTWTYDMAKTNKDIARYGVPISFYENISEQKTISKARRKMIRHGFYMQSGQYLKPDRSAIISFYRPYCSPVSGGIINLLISENNNTRNNRIEMALKFVQDIPYGIPEIKDSTWEVYGMFTPPEIFLRMYADCDSKAILLSCILSYLINSDDILLLYQGREHALVGIKGVPEKEQKYVEVDGDKYILADVTGPARLAWGDDGNKFDATVGYKVEKIKIKGYRFHNI
ncbi:MAG: hypothetical protein V1904_05795 [Bacteroidota bacterium]